jgi:hypothetical protein
MPHHKHCAWPFKGEHERLDGRCCYCEGIQKAEQEAITTLTAERDALQTELRRILSDYADLCEVGALAKMQSERDALAARVRELEDDLAQARNAAANAH